MSCAIPPLGQYHEFVQANLPVRFPIELTLPSQPDSSHGKRLISPPADYPRFVSQRKCVFGARTNAGDDGARKSAPVVFLSIHIRCVRTCRTELAR